MALHAGLPVDDGMGEVERGAGGRCALGDQLMFIRMVAELLDDVGFPIHGAVLRIGRIQCGLAIGVLGKVSAELRERSGGAIGRHGLRQKLLLVFGIAHEQRLELVRGVAADGAGALHHELGLLQHLRARILLEKAVRNEGDD